MIRDRLQTERGLLSLLNFSGKNVLEIGCGEGYFSEMLIAEGASLIAIDPDEKKLAITKKKLQEHIDKFDCRVMSGDDLFIFDDNLFDFVFFSYSLHHHPEPIKAIVEAYRVLIPGGEIIVIEPVANGEYCRFLAPVHDETAVLAKADFSLRLFHSKRKTNFNYTVDWVFDNRDDLIRSLYKSYGSRLALFQHMTKVYPPEGEISLEDEVILWRIQK